MHQWHILLYHTLDSSFRGLLIILEPFCAAGHCGAFDSCKFIEADKWLKDYEEAAK